MSEHQNLLAQHDYAIVDLTIIGEEEWHDELPLQDIVPKDLENDVGRTPKLLVLEDGAPHMELITWNLGLARQGKAEYLFSCLLSAPDIAPEDMLEHLRDHLVFDSPQGKGQLRSYDGRVFPHLLRMLRPPTLRALFGPIKTWTFLLLHEWFAALPPETDLMRRYWALHEKERARVDWIYQINQVLTEWQWRHNRPWKDLDDFHVLSEQVEQALREAQAHTQDRGKQNDFALRRVEEHSIPSYALRQPDIEQTF